MNSNFKAGDIVYFIPPKMIARTIENISGDYAHLVWEDYYTSALLRERVMVSTLQLSPFNPRTMLSVGDVVQVEDSNEFMTVVEVSNFKDNCFNPSVTCVGFGRNLSIKTETYLFSQLTKINYDSTLFSKTLERFFW